jgi:hypothetical protein
MNLIELPLKFNKVSGYFNCSFNKLTSLKGSPKEVGTFFTCYGNKLIDLKYAPNRIGSWFDCSNKTKKFKNFFHKTLENIEKSCTFAQNSN